MYYSVLRVYQNSGVVDLAERQAIGDDRLTESAPVEPDEIVSAETVFEKIIHLSRRLLLIRLIKNRISQPLLEARIVHELLEQLRVVC